MLTLEGTSRFGFRGGGKAGAAPRPHQNAAYSSMMQCYTPFSLQNPLAGETTDSSTTVILHEPTRMRQETYYTILCFGSSGLQIVQLPQRRVAIMAAVAIWGSRERFFFERRFNE